MNIFPAIDLYGGKAVRLYKGDYANMTVYSDDPVSVAMDFEKCGAEYIHVVDLEGAKIGSPCAYETVKSILSNTSLKLEIGGGIRNEKMIKAYVDLGVDRVILGTAAVNNEAFMSEMAEKYGSRLAVGVDIKDGYVAIKGWTEKSNITCDRMFSYVSSLGISRVICTDVSKDGAMQGTNRDLYAELSKKFNTNIIASGGVSTLDDIKALNSMGIFGAIIGKAYYVKSIDLKEALEKIK